MQNPDEISKLFLHHGGVLTTRELNDAGLNQYAINKLLASGEIERINHGLYRAVYVPSDEWAEVKKLAPKGVFCLFSAALLHQLSTFVSSAYQIAIPWKDKIRLPKDTNIDLYYWKDRQYDLGITTQKENHTDLPVYDVEKTVCDFVKFRNKVGLDITKEVLRSYLSRRDRNLHKLSEYAKQLQISTVLDQFLKLMV